PFPFHAHMRRRVLAHLLLCLVGTALFAAAATAEDLLDIYRVARENAPAVAAARASWSASQEAVPQARAALLPFVGVAGSANQHEHNTPTHTHPSIKHH